ncbi:TraB/GumN family protein [Ningiella sp. W23]|uniref:TraB/GumN family protein n=1 Tax=Ningiella sp. W23 TaxID=3023715 RepID=UPI0037568F74
MMKFLLSLCLASVVIASVQASAVYKLSKGDDWIYLGGTIHVLSEADFPLAAAYEIAFEQADEVVFETDLAAFARPETQAKLMPVMMQPEGQTLSSQLSSETLKALTEHLSEKGLPIAQIDGLTATGAMLTLTIMEFESKGFSSEGVDAFYHTKALKEQKSISWLESVDTQIALLDSFDNGSPNELIEYTLLEMAKSDEAINALYSAWKSGDMKALASVGLTQMKEEHPQIYRDLMVDRNNKWLPQIELMFGDENTEYVLVGALHLAGEDGILKLMQEKGYHIEKL